MWTPLMTVSRQGNLKIIRTLIKAGANVNARLPDGRTALILAIENEHSQCAEALIEAGADVNLAGGDTIRDTESVVLNPTGTIVIKPEEQEILIDDSDDDNSVEDDNNNVDDDSRLTLRMTPTSSDSESQYPSYLLKSTPISSRKRTHSPSSFGSNDEDGSNIDDEGSSSIKRQEGGESSASEGYNNVGKQDGGGSRADEGFNSIRGKDGGKSSADDEGSNSVTRQDGGGSRADEGSNSRRRLDGGESIGFDEGSKNGRKFSNGRRATSRMSNSDCSACSAQNFIRNQKKAKSRKGKGNTSAAKSTGNNTERLASSQKPHQPDTENEKTGRKVRKWHPKVKFVAPIRRKNIKYTEDLDVSQLDKAERRRYQQAMYQRRRTQGKIAEAAKKAEEEKKLQNCRDCRVKLINMGSIIEAVAAKNP